MSGSNYSQGGPEGRLRALVHELGEQLVRPDPPGRSQPNAGSLPRDQPGRRAALPSRRMTGREVGVVARAESVEIDAFRDPQAQKERPFPASIAIVRLAPIQGGPSGGEIGEVAVEVPAIRSPLAPDVAVRAEPESHVRRVGPVLEIVPGAMRDGGE